MKAQGHEGTKNHGGTTRCQPHSCCLRFIVGTPPEPRSCSVSAPPTDCFKHRSLTRASVTNFRYELSLRSFVAARSQKNLLQSWCNLQELALLLFANHGDVKGAFAIEHHRRWLVEFRNLLGLHTLLCRRPESGTGRLAWCQPKQNPMHTVARVVSKPCGDVVQVGLEIEQLFLRGRIIEQQNYRWYRDLAHLSDDQFTHVD